jgi:hypothetical protein
MDETVEDRSDRETDQVATNQIRDDAPVHRGQAHFSDSM